MRSELPRVSSPGGQPKSIIKFLGFGPLLSSVPPPPRVGIGRVGKFSLQQSKTAKM